MNIDTLNTKQLRALREKIDATIVEKQRTARVELQRTFRTMAADCGLSLDEIIKPGSKPARAMKWRDKTTGVEWSGMGRRPFKFDMKRAERIT